MTYEEKRAALMADVEVLKAQKKTDGMNAKMAEIEQLDAAHELALANENAMKNQALANPIQMNVPTTGTKKGETMENQNPVTYTAASPEYREAYLANLQGKTLTEDQKMVMSVVSASGVIPTTTVDKIMGVLDNVPLINAVNMMNIPGNISIPVEGTVNAASWVAMGSASSDSSDTVNTVSLAAYKLIKTVEITADVEAMSINTFETWLVERLANKIAYALDAAILTGTGSSQATGLLKADEITNTGTYTKAAMAYKDLTKIMLAHNVGYVAQASIHDIHDLFRKMKKAIDHEGPSFINLLSPCIPGWKIDADRAVESARMGVDCNYWPLFEVEDGRFTINYRPEKPIAAAEWALSQGRFKHLKKHPEVLKAFQAEVDRNMAWLEMEEARTNKVVTVEV